MRNILHFVPNNANCQFKFLTETEAKLSIQVLTITETKFTVRILTVTENKLLATFCIDGKMR
jgi:hypothetical protein